MKTISTKNVFFTGTLLLTAAGILSRIIGFFYRIFLSRVIGAEGLGIYQLVFPVMAICFSLTSAGIQTSISKFVSEEIGNQNIKKARTYLYIGLVISVSLSVLTGLFMWNKASFIASAFLGEPRCEPLLKVLSFCYVPCSIHSCINGYYYGQKKALVPSISQLVEQFVRVGSVYLIYLIAQSNHTEITISMAIWGIVLGEAAGMLVSLSVMGLESCDHSIVSGTKMLIKMAVPLTANRLVLNFFSSIENILIPSKLGTFGYTNSEALSVYGILTGMAMAIVLFPTVLTNSISVLLLPTISEAAAKHNQVLIRKAILKTTECCLLLGFLCTLCLLVTGNFIGNFVFDNSLAGTFIVTLSWICPFLYLSTTLGSILHGLGHPGTTFWLNLSACVIRILSVFYAVPIFGIKGYLFGLLISQIFSSMTALIILYHKMKPE